MKLNEVWKNTLSTIEVKIDSPADFKTWFADTQLISLEEGIATVGCKNEFVKNWLENNYKQLVKESLEKHAEGTLNVEFRLKISQEKANDLSDPIFTIQKTIEQQRRSLQDKALRSGLNLRYTFDNFIVGSSNRLAHAAALAVSDNPGTTYNPFYVYGGVGLGKTHVMQAIGNELLEKKPDAKILYCSSETFLNEMINAIRSAKNNEFRSKYRELDLLMIDDIQFISNKVETQTELFHTFNVLHQANKQIVLASDRPPTEIQNLEDRLRSRFQGGMVADISQPDFEMRIAILQKKCEERKFGLNESTIHSIAKMIESNIRELEGALIKVAALAGINEGILTEKEIAKILGKDARTKQMKVKPREIVNSVCDNFAVNMREIRGKRRTANIALARQLAMYLLREELELPLVKVARELNRNDHTTVLHAIEKVEGLIEEDVEFKQRVGEIKRSLTI